MTNQFLTIKAKCRANDPCLFDGRDMFVDISIINNGDAEVGFPLEFLRGTGPVIRLIDTRSNANTYLKTNLADLDLQEKFTAIQPGQSVGLEWVILSNELVEFGRFVNVVAEITIQTKVLVNGQKVEFQGRDTLRIVSRDPA